MGQTTMKQIAMVGTALVVLVAGAAVAQADYYTDFSSADDANDFNPGEIGQTVGGTAYDEDHNFEVFDATAGTLSLTGRYGQDGSVLANIGTYSDTYARMEFTYAAAADHANIYLAVRMAKVAAGSYNNYPVYYAQILGDGAGGAVLDIVHWSGWNTSAVLASTSTMTLAGGATNYTLDLSAVGSSLTAALYADGSLVDSVSVTDSGIASGYVGMAGGNDTGGTVNGALISFFSVGSTGFVVPEPATMSLLGVGLIGALLRRRK